MDNRNFISNANEQPVTKPPTSSNMIAWFAVGQTCEIAIGGVRVSICLIGQKGRRSRLAVVAPPGATFSSPDSRGGRCGPKGVGMPRRRRRS
jgi:hypothetical protein